MAKNTDRSAGKKTASGQHDKNKIYVDELYFRHVDQIERWRREAEHYQSIENKLAEMSYFSYEEVDYVSLLTRVPFKEKTVPDYSYMVKDARVAAESKFFLPISIRLIFLIVLAAVLVVATNSIVLWISGGGVLAVLILLFLLVQEKHSYVEKAVQDKEREVEERTAYEKKKIEDEKKAHEDKEDQRIKDIEDLLAGELSAIFFKMETGLRKLNLFFDLTIEIDLYHNIPSIKVWLPSKNIIPNTICALQSSGRTSFTEKEARVINKQYLELCAGIFIKVLAAIYSHIPSFSTAYIYGMSKEGMNTECLIASRVERDNLITACNARSGLEGMQAIKASFQCNTALALMPIPMSPPGEWGSVEQKLVRRLQVDLSRQ